MEVLEFQFASRYHAAQYLGHMGWSSYQVCTTLSREVQCECTLFIPPHVCEAPLILELRGIPSM